ncbi:succinyl-CoA synthetase, alpha subunit [Bacteroides coprosuis DSM 18011]|uniref:Succinate--CoA ligase [ADP-forming] subunit alpha n=1 Tax=Bacteroides coprosuis DSM 18011 TaxID=679937 RepID=F3ZS97_9BACE|nr:succinate--CoA ligase subunit alpha [Bacteroides coprosuis]EGJ70834.1 succinyl-CoA synthetase, alpha subunit [Bacteroides coprosuis DSM 18011]
MSILIDKKTKVLVQGITGRDGSFHTEKMLHSHTQIVAGTSPGKGGTTIHGVPVFNLVSEAVEKTGANTSIIFVPAPFAADAIMEAAASGIQLIICITEGIPTIDVVKAYKYATRKGALLIGPNCPGLMSSEESLVGILPAQIFKKGPIGVVSRSGTLTYEVVYQLSKAGLGQSTAVGIGGDPVVGLYFIDILRRFELDPETKGIVLIGEIGGDAEECAAEYIREHVSKPVVAFIAGRSAPAGKQMGHAGAIISSGSGTAEEKIESLKAAGVKVAQKPSEIPQLMKDVLFNK